MSDEQELLARLRLRDEGAFTEFFELHAERVYRVALGLLQQTEDAEEVVQATFLSAFQALDRFEPHARMSTWLYRIAYNHALMLLRRRSVLNHYQRKMKFLPFLCNLLIGMLFPISKPYVKRRKRSFVLQSMSCRLDYVRHFFCAILKEYRRLNALTFKG